MYIWDKFVNVHQIAKLGVELFESIDSEIITKEIAKSIAGVLIAGLLQWRSLSCMNVTNLSLTGLAARINLMD